MIDLVKSFKGNRAVCLCASPLRSLRVWERVLIEPLTLEPMGIGGRGGAF